MKKILATSIILLLAACKPAADASRKPLYEVLTQQEQGGAQVRFFEILTEEKEIAMLLSDEHLKHKIKPADNHTANIINLKLGEQSSGGHSNAVQKVEERPDKIIVTIREQSPGQGQMATSVMSYPYTIVKINSKKAIEIRD